VTGRVTDKAGQPIGKGSVVLWKDGRGTPSPFTDGKYSAVLSGTGKYRIEVRGPGYAKSSQDLQAEQGQVYRLHFTLQPGGIIRGKVTDRGGRPLQEGDVFTKDGGTSFGVPIDRDGTYKIEGLAPGQYNVSVIIGEKEVSRNAQVEAGRETLMDFVVQ
jgi:hypothetical protein